MGDAACEGPPFPSRLLSKHIPSAKKTLVCGTCKGCRRGTARYNLVEPGSPISPLQGGPAFSCLHAQLWGRISYVEFRECLTDVHKTLIIPIRIMVPHRPSSQGRGNGAD